MQIKATPAFATNVSEPTAARQTTKAGERFGQVLRKADSQSEIRPVDEDATSTEDGDFDTVPEGEVDGESQEISENKQESQEVADIVEAIAVAVRAVVDVVKTSDHPTAVSSPETKDPSKANSPGVQEAATAPTVNTNEPVIDVAAVVESGAASKQGNSDNTEVTQPLPQQTSFPVTKVKAHVPPLANAVTDSGPIVIETAVPAAQNLPMSQPVTAENAPATTLPNIEKQSEDPNAGRIARGIQTAINQRGGTVRLRLTPPELGTVRIELQMKDGVVRANLSAPTESARTLLQHQLGSLRHALEGQGLVVDRLSVSLSHQGDSAAFTSDQSSQHSQADGRSRGQYAQGRFANNADTSVNGKPLIASRNSQRKRPDVTPWF